MGAPMPHFLHLHSTFAAGGKELRCVQLMGAWGADARHTIVSADPARMEAADLIPGDVSWRSTKGYPSLRGRPTFGRLRRLAEGMRAYDLVMTYNWGAMDAVLAHRLFSRRSILPPLIHHEDGFNEDEFHRLKRRRNWYRRLALPTIGALVVPSRQLEAIAITHWKRPPDTVARIPNGIDVASFAKAPHADALDGLRKHAGEKWVGTLAGLRRVKNLPRLVRAFAALSAEWKLVIVGEGPEREAILHQAERCGVSDRVILPGFHADPARYVGLFDIFALSSDTEQFPISVAEAMAAARPIVAPDVGDVATMVGELNRSFISQRSDERALSAAFMRLAKDETLRDRIGAENRDKAAHDFDQSAMIARYRSLYWSAMDRRSA